MAQPTNTHSTYDTVGIREDLENVIYRIDPTECPFQMKAAKGKATSTLHEWQTQALAAASTSNAVIEGDEATVDAATATVRLNNRLQISDKVATVSGTNRAVNSAGRGDELAYQMVLKGLELRRDMEAILTANQAKATGSDSVARTLASVESWIKDNVSKASDGTNPTGDGTDARVDGTARAFTEAQFKSVLLSCWTNGGEPGVCMLGGFNKQVASGFTGYSTRFDKSEEKTLTAAIDVYKSDFGDVQFVPNRFMRTKTALLLDMDYWSVAFLRKFTSHELAKTGDTDKRQIVSEYTLVAKQPKASGIVADLTAS